MTDNALRSALDDLCAEFSYDAPASWSVYFELAHLWGKRMNLTAARDAATLCELLFLDALQLMHGDLVERSGRWVDIGAGVGAPTIPIALCWPEIHATLVEPRRKRVAFLRNVIGTLGLTERVEVLEERIDPAEPVVGDGAFTLALSRATFEPREWIRIGLELAEEVLVFGTGEVALGFKPVSTVAYRVPSTGAPRTLCTFMRQP